MWIQEVPHFQDIYNLWEGKIKAAVQVWFLLGWSCTQRCAGVRRSLWDEITTGVYNAGESGKKGHFRQRK